MRGLKIGIVEDEQIIAEDMKDMLYEMDHQVCFAASSYEEARDKLSSHQPDLLLVDIRLKGHFSGIDLAKYVNEHCSIPFIYITSNTDQATLSEVKATYPYGFIVKPFDDRDLLVAIEMAWENYERRNGKKPGEKQLSPSDTDETKTGLRELVDAYLKKSIEANQTFGVDDLAAHLNMSARTLARKIKASSGISVVEYIRNYRLELAKTYLNNGYRISEVAYKTGFSNQQYFSTCFKNYFGINPKSFRGRGDSPE